MFAFVFTVLAIKSLIILAKISNLTQRIVGKTMFIDGNITFVGAISIVTCFLGVIDTFGLG